jgi:hypothetical protein
LTRIIISAVLGGGLGFACYKFVGCSDGACPLTSNPLVSTIYGMILGALIAGSLH